ncbi:hypothetical protein [Telluribacter humicola]|uniref:hypothetical protein n=1 Tax=Telluribacter humicola TaxID=1720261 RepID=UPI001A968EB2|nr:hypothetical protein [Telluribacter humicola]
MNYKSLLLSLVFCLVALRTYSAPPRKEIYFCGSQQNDLYEVLAKEGFILRRFDTPATAIQKAPKGAAVFIVAEGYPEKKNQFNEELLKKAQSKSLRLYIEYPSEFPGLAVPAQPLHTRLERGVVTSPVFGADLKPMRILGINDCYILPVKAENPLIILAKVAGFDKAEYGIDDITTYPLLFERGDALISTTKLSNFATGRYGPNDAWKTIWSYIVTWATGVKDIQFEEWPSHVAPMYSRNETLPKNAKARSVEKGVEWFANGRFYVQPSWEDTLLKYQGDGGKPFGPPVSQNLPNGDGSMGLLEGHASNIYHDGSQQYRFWMRADVQGEGAFALAAAGHLLDKKEYYNKATNLVNYIFQNSNLRAGERNDKSSPSYGLIGWSVTHPHVYYGDDNARAILGILGASAFMDINQWDKEMAEAIMANFRTTGRHGYRGERQEDKDIQKLGWQHYWERDLKNPAPHFESWMWACYLWLYEKTGYEPLLTKTKNAIRLTMEGYPQEWRWTNGIQQERARMVLPLAWLVRIEDTPEHRQWLDLIVQKLLENQVESGAIREELGGEGKGRYGRTKSNKEYGLHEAPLIFKNGDPIADMLYTSNFAFFSLNEAAHATGNKQYKEAVNKLSDFLTRIQVKSEKHKDLDGAWFRAFEYDKWEYWASNADVGWGAWGTLTGWTQSWIVATQVLTAKDQSFWELTKNSTINKQMPQTLEVMFPKK